MYNSQVFSNMAEAIEFARGNSPKPVRFFTGYNVADYTEVSEERAFEIFNKNLDTAEIRASKPIGGRGGEVVVQPKS